MYDDGRCVTWAVACFPQEEWTFVFNQQALNRDIFFFGKFENKQKIDTK
jgi:hypothetical protein